MKFMVTKGKVKDRQSDTNWCVYVLELENQKYYVGIAIDPEQRFVEHKNQQKRCSSWCKKHRPKTIEEIIDTGHKGMKDATLLEDIITLKYINKHGAANVRGGRYLGSEIKIQKASDCHLKRGYITILHRLLEEVNITYQEIDKLKLMDYIVNPRNESYLNNLILTTSKSNNQKEIILKKLEEKINQL